MIHWDWVWTVLIMSFANTVIASTSVAITEPLRAERMKAEAALLEQKRLYEKPPAR